jgi:hypothetical protein
MLLEKARKILGPEFVISDEELAESIKQFELLGELAFELEAAQCYEGRGEAS